MSEITTFQHWPVQLREKRGLLNGSRVQMAYEVRGLRRYQFARKLGMPAKELARREEDWCFWDEREKATLTRVTDFPLAFFVQEDPPTFDGPTFLCGHDEDGNSWGEVECP